jgi:hypothetical protein
MIPSYNKIIQKRETGKVRLVIGSNIETYLKCHYLSEMYIDKFFMGNDLSTLWMTSEQTTQFWESSTNLEGYAMPLDQSKFDQMQIVWCVMIIVKYLKRLIDKVDQYIIDMVEEELLKSYVYHDGKIFKWLNGLWSGQKWTALIGTIINIVTARMAERIAQEEGIYVRRSWFCAQGDDDNFRFRDLTSCFAVYQAYLDMGYIVNPKKFYISRTRDEFLRKVIYKNEVTGYPARSITSLLWSNPVKTEVEPTTGKTLLATWHLFASRLRIRLEDTDYKSDIMQGMKWSRLQFDNFIRAAGSLGGAGLQSVSSTTIRLMPNLPKKPEYTFEGPGVKTMGRLFGQERRWREYAAQTIQFYPAGRPDKKQYFGDGVPEKYKRQKEKATVFVGPQYRTQALTSGRRWFPSWRSVKTLLSERLYGVKKEQKEFSVIIYNWRREMLNVIGSSSSVLEPIPPASIQSLSIARETASKWSTNYDACLSKWSRATKFIKETALFEGFTTIGPVIPGLSIGYSSYLTKKWYLDRLITKLAMKDKPSHGAYLQLQVMIEQKAISRIEKLKERNALILIRE